MCIIKIFEVLKCTLVYLVLRKSGLLIYQYGHFSFCNMKKEI